MEISFFASLKNLKKHEFHFLQVLKSSKSMNSSFASLQTLKKHGFNLFANLKSSQSMDLIFVFVLQAQKSSKHMSLISCKVKKAEKT